MHSKVVAYVLNMHNFCLERQYRPNKTKFVGLPTTYWSYHVFLFESGRRTHSEVKCGPRQNCQLQIRLFIG